MPCDYTIDVAQRLVRITATGVVTRADLIAVSRRLHEDPAFTVDGAALFDFSLASIETTTLDEIKSAATQPRRQPSPTRRAFVAPQPAIFGTLRMYLTHRELTGDSIEMRVFKTTEEAETWLGVA